MNLFVITDFLQNIELYVNLEGAAALYAHMSGILLLAVAALLPPTGSFPIGRITSSGWTARVSNRSPTIVPAAG